MRAMPSSILGKGVVAATLVANNAPINAELISAHDHESQWVFDLLFNNTTDIQSTIHSTDTHGTNQVNFGLLKVFGWTFAPRYADIYDKIRTALYGFRHPSQYGADALFRPVRKLKTDLIINQWDNMQRIFVSLARKTTTQSVLISKLSSSKRRNPMLQGLWEYDHVHRSGYLLKYVDSERLRRNVQKALNRGEQYQQMKRAVSHANAGRLRYTSEDEQALWSECSRLLANALLFYNMLLLSEAIARKEAQGDAAGAAFLRAVSPIAWTYINFFGRFAFNEDTEAVPLAAFVEMMTQYRPRPHDQTIEEPDDEESPATKEKHMFAVSNRGALD
ncbi:MAG: Tn3 family transposase [Herpetosiphonaceae bacterium]|nr:Tn3 family transposase [Herpetosiphonaceae bacterium]